VTDKDAVFIGVQDIKDMVCIFKQYTACLNFKGWHIVESSCIHATCATCSMHMQVSRVPAKHLTVEEPVP
jgi:hypothetical protein